MMLKKLAIALLIFFQVGVFGTIIQKNGPYCEYDDLYFDARKEVFLFPKKSKSVLNSFWDPVLFKKVTEKNVDYKKAKKWKGTTLVLTDSCQGFLVHYFHFLEHILGVWQFGGKENANDVRQIVFCSEKTCKKGFGWQGVNQINKKLIAALFPRAKVYTLASLKKHFPGMIYCEKALISSRFTAYKNSDCRKINKMLGASWQDIEPQTIESFRETVFSSLGVREGLKRNSPRITYIKRNPPRCLTPDVEQRLLQEIKEKTQLQVHTVDFAAIPFEEQLRIIANTDILMGVHGNGLSHLLFLPSNAVALEFFPPTGFTWDYGLLAKVRGISYFGFTFDGCVTDVENPRNSEFIFHGDLNKSVNTLDIEAVLNVIQFKKEGMLYD